MLLLPRRLPAELDTESVSSNHELCISSLFTTTLLLVVAAACCCCCCCAAGGGERVVGVLSGNVLAICSSRNLRRLTCDNSSTSAVMVLVDESGCSFFACCCFCSCCVSVDASKDDDEYKLPDGLLLVLRLPHAAFDTPMSLFCLSMSKRALFVLLASWLLTAATSLLTIWFSLLPSVR